MEEVIHPVEEVIHTLVIIVSAQSKELGFWVFSCEDAAQQVLMSVCPSVCVCVCV